MLKFRFLGDLYFEDAGENITGNVSEKVRTAHQHPLPPSIMRGGGFFLPSFIA